MHKPIAKIIVAITAVVALALIGVAGIANAEGGPSQFKTTLDGYHEVPTLSSPGGGSFEAKINNAGDAIHYRLTFGSLSASVTQAHIHLGAPWFAGGVAAFLCTNLGNGPAGTPACPASGGAVSGTIHAADVIGPATQGLAAGDFANLIRAMRAGATYVNVHTSNFPAGEIRGPLGKFK